MSFISAGVEKSVIVIYIKRVLYPLYKKTTNTFFSKLSFQTATMLLVFRYNKNYTINLLKVRKLALVSLMNPFDEFVPKNHLFLKFSNKRMYKNTKNL